MPKILTVIPARMQANRLPGKPLADIAGEPMIVHVWRRAMEADIGNVVVATDHADILRAIESAGGKGVMTRADHVSGSDRVFEAVQKVAAGETVDIVVNLQGDLPTLDPDLLLRCVKPLSNPSTDIATLACEIVEEGERSDPNVVKVVGTPANREGTLLRALYFTRSTAPYGEGPLYHHIGLYAYRFEGLSRFVTLPPSALEKRERLEQLRALEAGMRIDVTLVDTIPLGVDTPADLERARDLFKTGADD